MAGAARVLEMFEVVVLRLAVPGKATPPIEASEAESPRSLSGSAGRELNGGTA